jgi:hypothetical protein
VAALGDVVLYTLDGTDAAKINAWRSNFRAHNAAFAGHKHPHEPGSPGATGHVAHTGLDAAAGQELPAHVTRTAAGNRLNLRVMLDGNDTYWATGVPHGSGPACWRERRQEG